MIFYKGLRWTCSNFVRFPACCVFQMFFQNSFSMCYVLDLPPAPRMGTAEKPRPPGSSTSSPLGLLSVQSSKPSRTLRPLTFCTFLFSHKTGFPRRPGKQMQCSVPPQSWHAGPSMTSGKQRLRREKDLKTSANDGK